MPLELKYLISNNLMLKLFNWLDKRTALSKNNTNKFLKSLIPNIKELLLNLKLKFRSSNSKAPILLRNSKPLELRSLSSNNHMLKLSNPLQNNILGLFNRLNKKLQLLCKSNTSKLFKSLTTHINGPLLNLEPKFKNLNLKASTLLKNSKLFDLSCLSLNSPMLKL